MDKSTQQYSFVLVAFLLFSFSTATFDFLNGHADNPLKGIFNRVFAFGDADTDKGNAPLLSGKNECILGFNAHSRLIIDYLCSALALPPVSPYMKHGKDFKAGVSFGVSGSTSLSTDLFVKKNVSSLFWTGVPQSFQTQIDWFNDFVTKASANVNVNSNVDVKGSASGNVDAKGSASSNVDVKGSASAKVGGGASLDLSDSLFWIGQMGVSDYTSTAGSVSYQKLAEFSVNHISELLTAIIAKGGKSIIVQGLPPIGCCPPYMALASTLNLDPTGCMEPVNAAIMIHNKLIQMTLDKFRKAHPDCTILYADCWSAYLEIVTHPEKYGIEEPFKACCGSGDGDFNFNKKVMCGAPGTSVCKDPSKYVNWDGVRLTQSMHHKLTDMFLHKGYCQPPFGHMVKQKSKKKCP